MAYLRLTSGLGLVFFASQVRLHEYIRSVLNLDLGYCWLCYLLIATVDYPQLNGSDSFSFIGLRRYIR